MKNALTDTGGMRQMQPHPILPENVCNAQRIPTVVVPVKQFLQGVSIACYAEPCISYGRDVCLAVRPSVCLSLTHWHCVKATQAIGSRNLSPTDSPRNL